jgi:hypothetical protein
MILAMYGKIEMQCFYAVHAFYISQGSLAL